MGSWPFVAWGWFEGVQVACRDRLCRGGCSRVEHRLVGTARPVAVAGTGSSLWGGAVEGGAWGGWCLARCWVLKARAFFCSGFSVRALLAGVLLPCWGGGAGVCGVPPVF